MADENYPRDMCGYGGKPPDAEWPGGARTAVQFVINYEEGAENCVLHGDAASEAFLSEIVGAEAIESQRHMNMESLYEYGSRAGFWRIWRSFTSRSMPAPAHRRSSAGSTASRASRSSAPSRLRSSPAESSAPASPLGSTNRSTNYSTRTITTRCAPPSSTTRSW